MALPLGGEQSHKFGRMKLGSSGPWALHLFKNVFHCVFGYSYGWGCVLKMIIFIFLKHTEVHVTK